MKNTQITLLLLQVILCFLHSQSFAMDKEQMGDQKIKNNLNGYIDTTTVYQSSNLKIIKLGDHIYQHISNLKTGDFGMVKCNGMLVVNDFEAVVFDTPTDDESSSELINFIQKELQSTIIALIPTHFHEDCIGGIEEFKKLNIPLYAGRLTEKKLLESNKISAGEMRTFDDLLELSIGDKMVYAEYFGEGHTKDNIVGYFPENETLFGGCLIKSLRAGKGYLGDANTEEWSQTVEKIKLNHPNLEIVVPGHGKTGGMDLLTFTIELFEQD